MHRVAQAAWLASQAATQASCSTCQPAMGFLKYAKMGEMNGFQFQEMVAMIRIWQG
jgi:hypothetical protein